MNTWIRKVGMGAVALTLAGVLGGCNNGDGGGALLRLFFGINGSGNCTTVIVDVDLEDADAVIARDEFGDVQCVLNAILEDDGCDVSFTELENGNLRAVISGCTIPAITNLFSCLFEQVDISNLQENSSAQCTCQTPGCDGTPPVCITEDPEDDPRTCEDCDNGIDDDGNGLVDCDDPNCENSSACEPTTTTSSTSTSTSFESTSTTQSTTTTVSVTTTTTNETFNCTVIFRLADDVTIGSLQWDTDYNDAPGEFLGHGGDVECHELVDDTIAAFNDVDAEDVEVLDSGIISLDGFTGPVNVSECTFAATVTPQADDFVITVTEASDPDLVEIAPLPDVVIESIECEDGGPTTTLSVTTTLPVTTTTGGPGPQNYTITFTLDEASAAVGALQWTVDYATATGEFENTGDDVECDDNGALDALFAPNDVDAERELTLGLIALDAFSAPATLVTCTFNGSAGDPPVPADFPLTIDDATDEDGEPITVEISVGVNPVP